jgi:hypothetical protein
MTRAAAIALASVLACIAEARAAGSPALTAVAPIWDAGTVAVGASVRHTYELRNGGTAALHVLVKPSCGCTTADYDRVIPPGASGHVSATLDTRNLRGAVAKTIHVTTDDPARPSLVLTIRAKVIGLLDVAPTDKPILRRAAGELRPFELIVAAPDGEPFAITRVEDDPILRASALPIDGTPAPGHRRFRVILTPKADLAVGTYTPTITLVTTVPKAERFPLTPTIVVAGPLAVLPAQLRIRSCSAPATVRITKTGASPFEVLGAAVSDRDFTASAASAEGGHAWDVTLRYVGTPDRHGPVNATLTITTNEPAQPTLAVAVAGEL